MHYEKKRFPEFTYEEKEDHGLFLLMQQANRNKTVERDEIMDILNK
ncbi:hypothetical protein [Galbibacter pacificus]|uniref:EF-hand domain-containing protein n=1 Tax=Galbibacter pacificus TaxID=2996052 RepID=A0ABT6FSA8_9FLAO|nr:hypothetical protein [Galbibacter pacificus]MDG3582729.1 hypothetical protein [Galbibacter pacificus]MDG3586152.1 hypothetical protein [Galbibacter pacificus]